MWSRLTIKTPERCQWCGGNYDLIVSFIDFTFVYKITITTIFLILLAVIKNVFYSGDRNWSMLAKIICLFIYSLYLPSITILVTYTN